MAGRGPGVLPLPVVASQRRGEGRQQRLEVALDGGRDAAAGGSGGARLSLVAYSTPKEAYADLIPAFQKTAAGRGVTFTQSYGASGAQSRAIVAGLPTDVAALSLAPDITKLCSMDLWQFRSHRAISASPTQADMMARLEPEVPLRTE